jgi:iron complex outermembrane receptor protein
MQKSKTCLFIILLGMMFILGSFPSVNAQQSSSDEFTLEEITVTAEKRTEDVQKVALSVTAVTGDLIRESAQNTLQDVLRNIASVEVGYSNRGGQINIRGIGSYVDTALADPAVAVIEDNIYNGNSLATFGNMYDTQRVEVLRGPQGTLYGRNATGGTINVVSNTPSHEFELTGNAQFGDYNLKHFDGAVNFPLSEKWAARVAFLRETHDGYLSSGDMDLNVLGTRAKVLYEASDNFSVLATYEYFWEKDHGSNSVPLPGSKGNLPRLGPPPSFGYTKPDVNNDGIADDYLDADGNIVAGGNGTPDLIDTGWIVPVGADEWTVDEWHPAGLLYSRKTAYSLQFDWDFRWGLLTAIPSYAETYNHNVDSHLAGISQSTSMDYTDSESQENAREQTSAEVRLTSPSDSAFKWLGGFYYMSSKNVAIGGPNEQDPTTWRDDKYHVGLRSEPILSSAIFGQATYPVTDSFRMTGGIRAAKDTLKKTYRIGLSNTGGDVLYDTGWQKYSQDINSTTYKFGVEFDPAEESMLYAQVATGFKQGGLNTTAPPTGFKPEELVAYELGMKNRFMDNRMQLNFEVFFYNYENMQAQMPDFAPIGDTGQTDMIMKIMNADTGKLKGADMELMYLLTEHDLVNISASYLSSEIGGFILPPNPFGNDSSFDMEGRQMSSSPKWAGTIAYEHTWEVESGATFTARLDTKISAGYYRTLEQWQPYAWNDGYHRSNFNATFRPAEGKWSAGVWVKNIENGAQYTWSVPFWRAQIKDPRTFGMNISLKY